MKKFVLLACLLASFCGHSQKKLTPHSATIGAYREFAPMDLISLKWKNNQAFTFISNHYQTMNIQNIGSEAEPLLNTKELEAILNKTITNDKFDLAYFPYNYQWTEEEMLQFVVAGKENQYLIWLDVEKAKIAQYFPFKKDGRNEIVSKNGKYLAWLDDNNIKITDKNANIISVTQDDNKAIVNGSDYVHRQEFGINRGMWFNEEGDKLLYYRKDETTVGNYPLTNFSTRMASVEEIKYPMAGMKSEEVTLVVYDIKKQKHITLKTGEPKEQFLTVVSWDPNGECIFVGLLNRDQNHLKMNKYDAKTGAFVQTLFEEKSETYVEPQKPLYFNQSNSNEFVYVSDRDGYAQAYLYNTNGKLIKKLGYKDVILKEILSFDKNQLMYIGTANRGMELQLYSTNTKKNTTEILTNDAGIHHIELNSNKTYFLDKYNNVDTPNAIDLVNIKNKKETPIIKAPNPYEGKIELPKMEFVTIKSADEKTDLNGRIIYPSNFDENKKYPVMIYVYGGPHAQLVTNSWLGEATLFDYYMAQEGYVVFTLDNRGSDNRGADFEKVIHRQLGQNEMKDQMKGVEYLRSLPFVDSEKIGVYGWSFGGFMTISLMTNYPDVFKVGVAGGPVVDWKWYEVMYGERYMDTPEQNPEGYEKTSLLNKAKNLKGRLLLIHGVQDDVVLMQHSIEFVEACIGERKQVDFFVYPTHKHNVTGMDRVHLNTKIADYFKTHLK